jgi:hypothetical protein
MDLGIFIRAWLEANPLPDTRAYALVSNVIFF